MSRDDLKRAKPSTVLGVAGKLGRDPLLRFYKDLAASARVVAHFPIASARQAACALDERRGVDCLKDLAPFAGVTDVVVPTRRLAKGGAAERGTSAGAAPPGDVRGDASSRRRRGAATRLVRAAPIFRAAPPRRRRADEKSRRRAAAARRGLSRRRAETITPGDSEVRCAPRAAPRPACAAALDRVFRGAALKQSDAGACVIAAPGGIKPDKGQLRAAEAVAALGDAGKVASLAFYGKVEDAAHEAERRSCPSCFGLCVVP